MDRNFLRHEVMDMLSRLNPAAVSALNRLAESAATDEDFLSGQLESLARAVRRPQLGRWLQHQPAAVSWKRIPPCSAACCAGLFSSLRQQANH